MTRYGLPAGRVAATFASGLLLALALTGCDKAAEDGTVASAGATASPTVSGAAAPRGDALKFAQCMRENGVPDFRDPGAGGGALLPEGTDPKVVQAAQDKCKQYMPNGGEPPKVSEEDLERSRKLAQCMRDNGVPDFPDPEGNVGGGQQLQGVDTNSPEFKAAQKKCEQIVPRPSGTGPAAVR